MSCLFAARPYRAWRQARDRERSSVQWRAVAIGARCSSSLPTVNGVFTLPNAISLVRALCIPWFVWLVFGAEEEYQAAWLLGALGATDWVDGFVARRFNQVSTVGKVLDPAIDRLLLIVAGVTILAVGAMPLWFAVLVLTREVLIGVGGIYLGVKGHTRLDVEYSGKVGAFMLMWSLPFFLAWHSAVFWADQALIVAWINGVIGLVFNWYSAYGYFRRARILRSDATHSP